MKKISVGLINQLNISFLLLLSLGGFSQNALSKVNLEARWPNTPGMLTIIQHGYYTVSPSCWAYSCDVREELEIEHDGQPHSRLNLRHYGNTLTVPVNLPGAWTFKYRYYEQLVQCQDPKYRSRNTPNTSMIPLPPDCEDPMPWDLINNESDDIEFRVTSAHLPPPPPPIPNKPVFTHIPDQSEAADGDYTLRWRLPGEEISELLLRESLGSTSATPSVKSLPINSTSYTANHSDAFGKEEAVKYYYSLKARNVSGESGWTDWTLVTIPQNQPPTVQWHNPPLNEIVRPGIEKTFYFSAGDPDNSNIPSAVPSASKQVAVNVFRRKKNSEDFVSLGSALADPIQNCNNCYRINWTPSDQELGEFYISAVSEDYWGARSKRSTEVPVTVSKNQQPGAFLVDPPKQIDQGSTIALTA
nr:hypothetical protein [Gammaproteobacteria bacterium]